jgi:hypothetical protein
VKSDVMLFEQILFAEQTVFFFVELPERRGA